MKINGILMNKLLILLLLVINVSGCAHRPIRSYFKEKYVVAKNDMRNVTVFFNVQHYDYDSLHSKISFDLAKNLEISSDTSNTIRDSLMLVGYDKVDVFSNVGICDLGERYRLNETDTKFDPKILEHNELKKIVIRTLNSNARIQPMILKYDTENRKLYGIDELNKIFDTDAYIFVVSYSETTGFAGGFVDGFKEALLITNRCRSFEVSKLSIVDAESGTLIWYDQIGNEAFFTNSFMTKGYLETLIKRLPKKST